MSSILSAELAAACNALGYYDVKSNKYYADSNTLETVKDLIRYLRRDDETHDVRRQLGEIKVLPNDLIPLVKSYSEEIDLFDVLLRLLVNLTTPALMLWNEEPPPDKIMRNHFLQIEDHLKSYKQTFADESFWAVLTARLSQILEIDYSERGDENSLIIERILILIRNILFVPPDPASEKRPDNDASVHDQVLWALHQSGMLDIILYITGAPNERTYYMHTLEILSHLLREQKASELAHAALQRSETEKMRDEAELLAIRHKETKGRQRKIKIFNGARHSRFGGTFVLKSMKSISDNELIYHKPLNQLESLNFDANKTKPKTPKNRAPMQTSTYERRSAFSIRLFLKEFCVEFLNGAYNTLMYHVKHNLVRAKAQANDESYYLWALRFFMEFNRCYKFEVKLVSETMSFQIFRYVQQLMENYFDMIQTDKKRIPLWSRRLHLALLAYRELFLTINCMDKSPDETVRTSAKVIKSNVFYILEYRELILSLLVTYDELKFSNAYLKDLLETQHVFLKMLESFCGKGGVVVQKKATKRTKKRGAPQESNVSKPDVNLERQWDETAPQLSTVLEGALQFASDIVPFDAASDVPIDEQKTDAMKNVQRKLRNGEFENAIGLLRASREVWPENNCFGSNNMAPEEEFLALRDIFFADLGEDDISPDVQEQPVYDENDEEEDEDGDEVSYSESNFKFEDFVKRLANPKVVRACGLALRHFETNSVNTNHCILKLLHRIAFDCKAYVMVFQVSIFMTFQKIYANKDFPQYRELVKFATFVIRQFVKITEVNKKVYMESLFWKTSGEAYEVEYGYGFGKNKQKVSAKAWTEEQEDELRRLFMEHQQNQIEDDVVDWIVDNLVDNTKTRRLVLKKLKEMCLLVDRRKSSKARAPRRWSDEEERQLRELHQEFKDAVDPLGCIIARLDVTRSKPTLVQKMLELGLIRDKAEVRKKRGKSARGSDREGGRGSPAEGSDTDSEESDDDRPQRGAQPSRRLTTATKKKNVPGTTKKRGRREVTSAAISREQISQRLLSLVKKGLSEALDWLKESFSDALEDFDDDADSEGIPLVPIMDYAVEAMEITEFQETLKELGVCQPFDEQETYWRIPAHLSSEVLQMYVEMLQQAVEGTLNTGEQREEVATSGTADHDGEDETQIQEIPETSVVGNAIELNSDEDGEETEAVAVRRRVRKIVDDDSEDEENKRERQESDSEAERPKPKRSRVISSDED